MKNKALLLLGISLNGAVFSQTNEVATPLLLERGGSYRVWQTTTPVTNAFTGQVTFQTSHYTELGDGLCYRAASGQYADSKDLIELTAAGAQAIHGQHTVQFATDNLNAPGAVTLTTASGQVFASHPVGIYYFDSASGNTKLVAPLLNCSGSLHAPNQVVYSNAFNANGFKANVRYVYAKDGFAQDIEIWQLPAPQLFGMNPANTRLQVRTVFDRAPLPQENRAVVLKQQPDPTLRKTMVAPDLVGHLLFFGDLWFPVGAAFAAPNDLDTVRRPAAIRVPDLSDPRNAPVSASWTPGNGQTAVLIESVDYADLASRLTAASGNAATNPVILDYTTKSATSDSFEFLAGETYVINTSFTVGSSGGTAEFDGGTCVKFDSNAYLMLIGSMYFNYPVQGAAPVFTTINDDEHGAKIDGSTGIPTETAAQEVWIYYDPSYTADVGPAQFKWAQTAVQYDIDPSLDNAYHLDSSTFENSGTGVYADLGNSTLWIGQYGQDTYCNVATLFYHASGYYSGTISASCTLPTADFTASGTSGTAPLTVHFTDTSTGSIKAWNWDFGDGSTSSSQDPPSHTYNAANLYTVTLTIHGGDNITTAQKTVNIAVYGASFTTSPSPATGHAPLTVQFTDTSTGNPTSWNWAFGDLATSTDPSPSYIYNVRGTYIVQLTVTYRDLSRSTASSTITVDNPTPVNVSVKYTGTVPDGNQIEPTVAIDPRNTLNVTIFAIDRASHGGLFEAYTRDGGEHWTASIILDPSDTVNPYHAWHGDPHAIYDAYGNLFLTYLSDIDPTYPQPGSPCNSPANPTVIVLYSADQGATLHVMPTLTGTTYPSADQPHLATGPASGGGYNLWLTYLDSSDAYNKTIRVLGAAITGFAGDNANNIGAFGFDQNIANGGSTPSNSRLAVGPSGQVLCVWRDTSSLYESEYEGATTGSFPAGSIIQINGVNVSASATELIPATAYPNEGNWGVESSPSLAWDRSTTRAGTYGRVYLVYTDIKPWPSSPNDSDIYMICPDNKGGTWSRCNGGSALNSDWNLPAPQNAGSQFWPSIAVDQLSGNVAACWYDCRSDAATGNAKTQFWGGFSVNRGVSFVDFPFTLGQSSNANANWPADVPCSGHTTIYNRAYGDYSALDYAGGVLYVVWVDNSNSTGNNASGYFDVYYAK